jgi:hypothetical protein
MHTQKPAMTTPSVAARLAGVDHFEYAHAGKPDCYEVFEPAESLTDRH